LNVEIAEPLFWNMSTWNKSATASSNAIAAHSANSEYAAQYCDHEFRIVVPADPSRL